MAHTPGLWELAWTCGRDSVARIRLNGSTVYQVSDVTDPDFPSGKPRYNLDDLRLMAAAPELLAALKRVVAQANCAMEYSGVDADHMVMRALERISKAKCVCETAIATAEGRGE